MVAVDRLANECRFPPDLLLNFCARYRGVRGVDRVPGIQGPSHTLPEQVLLDAGRYTGLVDRGWRIYRYTKYDIHGSPDRIVAELTRGTRPR